MAKCIYKSSDGKCYCSISGHHCEIVTDSVCDECSHHQEIGTVSEKVQVQQLVRKALELLPSSIENREGREALYSALGI